MMLLLILMSQFVTDKLEIKFRYRAFIHGNNFSEKANFIWQVADDTLRVRGAFKAHEYGDVILPFVVLRRLDLVLEPQKDAVIKQFEKFKDSLDEERMIPVLRQAAGGINFYNHSFYDLPRAQVPGGGSVSKAGKVEYIA